MAENVLSFNFVGKDHFTATADKVHRKLDSLGSKFADFGKHAASMAAGMGLFDAISGVKDVMAEAFKDAENYQTLSLKTAAVIKSTGDAAHVSVSGIQEMAHKLQDLSGVSEETIQNSENVMLTFTNIRNSTGKNNDIFNQATKATLNLSSAMGEDLQSATVQVGKALNDPLKGMTALQRVGVTFSAQQKEQIKTMVKSGNTMGAQKLILKELNKEFGGAAKAAGSGFGGAMAKMKLAVSDAFRDLATKAMPTLTTFANWFAEKGLPAILKFADFIGPILGKGISIAVQAIRLIVTWVRINLIPPLLLLGQKVFPILILAVSSIVRWFKQSLIPGLQLLGGKFIPLVKQAWSDIIKAFTDHQDVLKGIATLFKGIWTVLKDYVWPVIVKFVIPAIGLLLVLVIKAIPIIVRIILTVIGAVITVITAIIKYTPKVVGAIIGVVSAITAPFRAALSLLFTAGKFIIIGLINGFKFQFITIPNFIGKVISSVKSAFNSARTWLLNAGKNVLFGFLDGLKAIWTTITGWVSGIATWIAKHKGPISLDRRLLVPAGRAIMMGFYHGLTSGAGKVWDFVKSVGGKTVSELSAALGMGGPTISSAGSNVTNMALGQRMNAAMGWGGFWPQLASLWTRESGWNTYAKNPSSGAYGIPQSLPASKLASAGSDWMTNPTTQIRWGLQYIAQRYGNPGNAWAHETQFGWYDRGGLARRAGFIPKLTNEPERVLSPRQTRWFERAMASVAHGGALSGGQVEAHFHFYNYVGDRQDLLRVLNQAARTGQLDAIVRLAR